MSELAPTYQRGSWSSLEQFLCLSCGYSRFSEGQIITHLRDLHGLAAVATGDPTLPLGESKVAPTKEAEVRKT